MIDFKQRLEQYKEKQAMAAKKPEDTKPTITDVLASIPKGESLIGVDETKVEDLFTHTKPTEDLTVAVSDAMKSIPTGANLIESVQPLSAGRVVSYNAGHPGGPYVAICVLAHNATCGNLVYWTHDGHQSFIERAVFGEGRRCWQWPKRV